MYTVGDYLLDRLHELGIEEIFGVPGDYNLQFLDQIISREDMKWIGNANELNASYMADGYARTKKAAAFLTTFGVGELSAINGLAGSYAENLPVVEIVGSPTSKVQNDGKFVHHTLADGDFKHFMKMHEPVTAARTLLTAENATYEIDRVLSQLLKERKPVYINLPVDVAAAKAEKPALSLEKESSTTNTTEQVILSKIEESLKNAQKPVVIAGHEVISFGLEKTVTQFVSETKLPITTLNFGKSAVDESLPSFLGIYNGKLSEISLKNFVESADFILMLGVKLTDSSTGAFTHHLDENKMISLNIDEGIIFNKVVEDFDFRAVVSSLSELKGIEYEGQYIDKQYEEFIPSSAPLSQDRLWQAVESLTQSNETIVAEQGTSFFGASTIFLKSNSRFIGQPLWGSIGYTFPAALGSQIADKESRHLLFIGDGSLQLTVQELGLSIREKLNPICFIINNDGYTVEREIHGPTQSYNDIPMWNYSKLPETLGATEDRVVSKIVRTENEFVSVMKEAQADVNRMYWIELVLEKEDAPKLLKQMGKLFAEQNK